MLCEFHLNKKKTNNKKIPATLAPKLADFLLCHGHGDPLIWFDHGTSTTIGLSTPERMEV